MASINENLIGTKWSSSRRFSFIFRRNIVFNAYLTATLTQQSISSFAISMNVFLSADHD